MYPVRKFGLDLFTYINIIRHLKQDLMFLIFPLLLCPQREDEKKKGEKNEGLKCCRFIVNMTLTR